jgi:Concanavalin A-like lectin/glucanases superfamily
MDFFSSEGRSKLIRMFILVIVLVGSLVAIYFLYDMLAGPKSGDQGVLVVPAITAANAAIAPTAALPAIYEGGEYTISAWLYVNSYNVNRNRRKHVLEIGGKTFSTLLIALGAFKNSLLVRTHSRDASLAYSASTADASGNAAADATYNTTPNSEEGSRQDGSLTQDDLTSLFAPMAMDDSLLTTAAPCDIPEIELQKWIHVVVVLNGRTTDVYLNGKLARSCVSRSYYKVDPTGVSLKLADRGGFDGRISKVAAYNYSLDPASIYHLYIAGPGPN